MPQKIFNKSKTSKSKLYFHHAGLTNTGLVRDHNEDAYKLPEDADAKTLATNGYLYILADGMGGHQKGEVASAVTIEVVNSEYYAASKPIGGNPEDRIVQLLSEAIEIANDQVLEATEGGGTTVVAAVLYDDMLVAMNVGDSRAYLLRDDELRLISRDHSLVSRLVETGKITAEEALNHPRRNVLYQALGQGPDLEIHTYSEKLKVNDWVILCSDGLWGEVQEAAIKEVLNEAASPSAAANRLIDMANASGGPDNITAILIHVCEQAPAGQPISEDKQNAHQSHSTNHSHLSPLPRYEKPHTLPEGKYHVD